MYNFAIVEVKNNLIQTINLTTMKKYFFFTAMLLSLVSLSCDKIFPLEEDEVRVEVDFGMMELRVYLNDADGRNLLDPKVAGAYPSSQISLTYNYHTFNVVNLIPAAATRTEDSPEWVAKLDRDENGVAFLQLLWWEALDKCEKRSVVISWGDGTSDTIAYSNDYTSDSQFFYDYEKNHGYTFYRKAYINGRVLAEDEYNGYSNVINYKITKAKEDIIVDWAPIFMRVYLRDEEGNNLLASTNANCYDTSKIVVNYEGKEYNISNPYSPETSEYLAVFGEIWLQNDIDGEAYLEIGEWDALDKCEMCSVEVVWGDGTTDTLAFSNDYTYNDEYRNDSEHHWGYTFIRTAYLNGEQFGEPFDSRCITFNLQK